MIDYSGQGILSDVIAEERFFSKNFSFSYSSLNKLLYSPKLFYEYYILRQREEKLDAHLIEGRLIHLLFLEEDNFNNNYLVLPGNLPAANNKKVVELIYQTYGNSNPDLSSYEQELLSILIDLNLHQKLKTDEQRLEKVLVDENKDYFKFLCEKENKSVIDQETYDRCKDVASQMKSNLEIKRTLFLDEDVEKLNELHLNVDKFLQYSWGLHGYLDNLTIKDGIYYINDIKTTSKSLLEFPDSVEYYSYWLQAAIYVTLVSKIYNVPLQNIKFNFCVIDKYKQIKCFPVAQDVLVRWQASRNKQRRDSTDAW